MPKNTTNSGKNSVSGTANMPASIGSKIRTSLRERATRKPTAMPAMTAIDRPWTICRQTVMDGGRPKPSATTQHLHLAPDQFRRRQQ